MTYKGTQSGIFCHPRSKVNITIYDKGDGVGAKDFNFMKF